MKDLSNRVENDFESHKCDELALDKMRIIRIECKKLAHQIVQFVPHGREQYSALTRLEEVMFHANAGIARNGTFDDL